MIPFFSIIIPLFNKEEYISHTMQSILDQSFTDFEVVVVDDGSTDDSVSKLSRFKDDHIRIIPHITNRGVSAARNTGIQNAKGEIVALLDADDLWAEDHLSNIFYLYKKYPQERCYGTGWWEKIGPTKILAPKVNLTEHDTKDCLIDCFFSDNIYQSICCQSSLAFDRKLLIEIGGYNESIDFGEDVDLYIRIFSTQKLAYTNNKTCFVNSYSQNQTTSQPITDKGIPDFDNYQMNRDTDPYLKKYLDFYRYCFALKFGQENNLPECNRMKKGIDLKNLNWKQRIYLGMGKRTLNYIKELKIWLLKRGVRVSTY